MKIKLLLTLFSFCSLIVIASAQQKNDQCPLSLADIERIFGKGFKEEAPSKFGESLSCRFSNKDYTIQINIQPGYGMKVEDYNKMMSPKTVKWNPIPNDPDKAQIEIREDNKDDLASTPAITYIRKDKYVRLQVLGNYYGYDKAKMAETRDEFRTKLSKLKRVPL